MASPLLKFLTFLSTYNILSFIVQFVYTCSSDLKIPALCTVFSPLTNKQS